jgi:zinc protease
MTQSWRIRSTLVAALIVVLTGLGAGAQQPATPARTAPLTATIPVDSQITTATLPNGLRYYIRVNRMPEKRAELRLVVNVGSIVEDADQQGLAHFVEHMAFNGTKNFPKQAIVSFMESIGMRFGPSVNAFTSFDETVYMLQVPSDKPEVLDKALLVLEDWAQNVTFDPAEIEKERGVVIEEWRLGQGAASRLRDKQFPVLLKGSRYAERLPIGKKEILDTFKPAEVVRFYKDWYRPDLMAVIAVGDFDRTAMETMIKAHFAPIPKPASPRPRPALGMPDQPGTRYTIATDKEMPSTTVSVYAMLPSRNQTTVGAYRQQIVEGLFSGMLSDRFAELAQKPDAPFLAAGASRGLFVRTREASTLTAIVKEDAVDRGLEALFLEAERVVKFGFTATELDRQKKNILRRFEQLLAEKDTHQSATLAAEYGRNFTNGEPIPGIAYEFDLQQRFLPEITLAEVNSLAKEWAPDGNRVVVVSGPDKPGVTMPTESRLAAVMAGAAGKTLTAYVDSVGSAALLSPLPTPGSIAKTTTRADLGITEWVLSNGATVVLKPTTFKEDEVVFRAVSPGGTSLASDADFIPAQTAAGVVGMGGLGQLSATDLGKTLAGKAASVDAGIGETEESLSGGGSPRDLETMFQLMHLTFTQPRADPVLFGILTSQSKVMIGNQRALPAFAFAEARTDALTQGHRRRRMPSPEMIDAMNLDKSMAFYKDRFADASDFTFVFVGTFTVDAIKPLVERYLASLPSLSRKETWKDIGVRPPRGVVERRLEKGTDPKGQASLVFTGPFQYEPARRVTIRAMATALETRLREVLREDLGGTYSVSVSAGYSKIPVSEYTISIDFGSAPERTDDLIKRVFEEIERFKADGPTEQQVTDVKTAMLRDYETNLRSNDYLASQMTFKYQFGEDVKGVFTANELFAALTPAALRDAARQYFTENYVKIVMGPVKK